MEDVYGAGGLNGMGGGAFDQMMNDDFYTEDPSASQMNSRNVEYDPEADEKKQAINEQNTYAKILKRFRVLDP